MGRVVMVLVMLVGCSSTPQEACSPEAAEAIMVGARRAVDHLIDSGACPPDDYPDIVACPAYQEVRTLAKRALEHGACR